MSEHRGRHLTVTLTCQGSEPVKSSCYFGSLFQFANNLKKNKQPTDRTVLVSPILFSFPLACKEAERDSVAVVIACVHPYLYFFPSRTVTVATSHPLYKTAVF